MIFNYYLNHKFKNPKNFFVSCKRIIYVFFYKIFNIYPSSSPFLSGDTFRKFSTFIYDGNKLILKKPEIIFVQSNLLKNFQDNINNIKKNFILISHNGDDLIDEKYYKILNNKYLIKWYSANTVIRNNKIIPIPLGLQNSRYQLFGVVNDFKKLRIKKKKKIPKIFCSFNIGTNPSQRKPALKTLSKLSLTDVSNGFSAYEYREKLNNYMFHACPEGNGLDTYRTWESLYLNVIPIVIKNNFYSQFTDFPALILNDWSDLQSYTEFDLKKVYNSKLENLKNSKFIWNDYWIKHIYSNFKNLN